MLHTRRTFLNTGLAVVGTCASAPTFLTKAAAQVTQPRDPDQHNILVVLQLSGGNDGLNTLAPVADPAYQNARPAIALAQRDAIHLQGIDHAEGLALHPNLGPVADLLQAGRASIIQGVGYPNPNRSHFASMDVWHAGDALNGATGGRGTGWIGRAMDQRADTHDTSMAVVTLGPEAPLAATGDTVKPIAFENADLFRYTGRDLHPAVSDAYDALHQTPAPPNTNSAADFVYRTQLDAQVASDRVRAAVQRDPAVRFPRTGLGNQLKMIAEMIKAELPTTVYYAAMGGFDTHANQQGSHARLMTEFAEAVAAFQRELDAAGQSGRVTTLAFSEFGRRVRQNASGGTDHGTAGPCFAFGNHLNPGLLGQTPSLTDLDDGDLKHTTDFRSVYTDLLQHWLHLDPTAALGQRFPSTNLFHA